LDASTLRVSKCKAPRAELGSLVQVLSLGILASADQARTSCADGSTDETSVMRDPSVSKESREHGQRLISQGLVDKRLLSIQRFNGLHGGSLSFRSSAGSIISGNSSATVGSRDCSFRFLELSGWPSTN